MSTVSPTFISSQRSFRAISDDTLVLLMVACFCMSAFDAYATVNHITNGIATEGNPIMNYFLEHGVSAFFFAKIGLTAMALTLLYFLRRWMLSRVGLGIALVAYYSVMIYHILIYQTMYVH